MKLSCLPVSLFADIIANKRTLSEWIQTAASLGLVQLLTRRLDIAGVAAGR